MPRRACLTLPLTALCLSAALPIPAQAGVPGELALQFRYAVQDAQSEPDRQALCRNAGVRDFSYSMSARCADTFNTVLARLRTRDEVIEAMIERYRGEMTAEDLERAEVGHRKVHDLIAATRDLAKSFEQRKASASY